MNIWVKPFPQPRLVSNRELPELSTGHRLVLLFIRKRIYFSIG